MFGALDVLDGACHGEWERAKVGKGRKQWVL